jgi:hypothetical protein
MLQKREQAPKCGNNEEEEEEEKKIIMQHLFIFWSLQGSEIDISQK